MKIISVEYVQEPTVSINNRDWKKIRQKLRTGYYVCERNLGVVVLEKEPKIIVTMEVENEILERNFKNIIKSFYGNIKSEVAFERFKADLENANVVILKNEAGYWQIKYN